MPVVEARIRVMGAMAMRWAKWWAPREKGVWRGSGGMVGEFDCKESESGSWIRYLVVDTVPRLYTFSGTPFHVHVTFSLPPQLSSRAIS